MAEQAPELVEQIGYGPNGATWKARQPDGREVLAFQTILTDEPARQAALDRLRRLAKIPSHRLAPIRGWGADAEGGWVVGDLEQGVSLPDLPGGGFLSPQQAAAISFGVLEGLDALHADGLNHGDLAPENVRVMPDGNIRLTGHQLATLHFPSQEELVAELRDAGRLVCQAFGITPERDSRAAPRAIEHAARGAGRDGACHRRRQHALRHQGGADGAPRDLRSPGRQRAPLARRGRARRPRRHQAGRRRRAR